MGTKNHRRGVAVLRVSKLGDRTKDGENGKRLRSTDDQLTDIEALAKRHGVKIVAVFEDLNQSGGTMDRPGMNEAKAMVLDRDADTILVAKVDRFARNVQDGLRVLDEIEAVGGSVICANLDVDTRQPVARMTFITMLNIAEWERNEKKAQMTRAAEAATREGIRIPPPPTGYKLIAKRQLVPDEKYADAVREVFASRAAGSSWSTIRLEWQQATGELRASNFFHRMIRNETYLGVMRYGDVIADEPHDAIVPLEMWEAAQRVAAPRAVRHGRQGSLLAGLLTCASCGRPMTASNDGRGNLFYRCKKLYADLTCPAPTSVKGEAADSYVVEQFLSWAGGITAETTDEYEVDFAAADARIEEAKRRLVSFVDAFEATDVDPRILAGKADRLQADIDAAVAEREQLAANRKVAGIRYVVGEQWPNLTLDQKRQMLSAGIDAVVVHPQSLTPAGGRLRAPLAERATITWRQD